MIFVENARAIDPVHLVVGDADNIALRTRLQATDVKLQTHAANHNLQSGNRTASDQQRKLRNRGHLRCPRNTIRKIGSNYFRIELKFNIERQTIRGIVTSNAQPDVILLAVLRKQCQWWTRHAAAHFRDAQVYSGPIKMQPVEQHRLRDPVSFNGARVNDTDHHHCADDYRFGVRASHQRVRLFRS